jgi:hypothetical protein
MSLVKEFEHFGMHHVRNNHAFPEQSTSLLDRERL